LTGGGRRRGFEEDPLTQLQVIDPLTQRAVQSWPTAQSGYDSRFAEHGHVLCAGDNGVDLYQDSKVPPRCMDADTGKTISEAARVVGGAPLATAEHATRVVVSDHKSAWNFLFREYDTTTTRRVVWDFRKNAEIASWKPVEQTYTLFSAKLTKDVAAFAISPDGEYVAEGGNGILRLYKVEP
jgi:hypothetical protein